MQLNRETIVGLGSTLAPSLQVFSRLGELLNDPNTDLDEIVGLVGVDSSLMFKILRLGNSVMFGLKHPCDSLDEAVARVGLREIHRVVGLAASHQAFQHDLIVYALPAEQLWENSVATAVAMETIARRTGGDMRAAYAAGLLRSVGRAIIDKVQCGENYPGEAARPLVAEWERSAYGLTAAEVSAFLLDHWRFPAELVTTVRVHLEPPVSSAGACRLNLAGHIVATLGLCLPGEKSYWELTPEKLGAAGVNEAELPGYLEETKTGFYRLRGALGTLKQAA